MNPLAYLIWVKCGHLKNGVSFWNILGYALVVVGTREPWAVVVNVLNVDNHLRRVRVWRAAQVLSAYDQLV